MFYKIVTKQVLYRHLITRRVLLALVVLNRLNELFSKKEQENKLAPEGLNQGAEAFTYDPVGNRLTGPKEKLNYTYNTANQLTELTKQKKDEEEKKREFTYDKNWNLIKKVELDDDGQIKRTTFYTYDYENRLTKVEMTRGVILSQSPEQSEGAAKNLKVVSFTYDPFGRRLSKSVSHLSLRGEAEAISEDDDDDVDEDEEDHHHPRATYYVYDNEDIIMEYNHKGKVTARYVHGLGIDEPLAVEKLAPEIFNQGRIHTHHRHHSHTYYYHADGLGSITALTNGKGHVVQRYKYDSFGNLKHHGHKVKQPYTYTAREYDRETGLYYYRARYYDAKVGRFISEDPLLNNFVSNGVSSKGCGAKLPVGIMLEEPQELNPFVYVVNNPVNKLDPFGLSVRTVNCSASDVAKIQRASAIAETASQTCLPCEDREPFKNKINNLMINCTSTNISPSGNTVCGYTYGGSAIYVTPAGITGIPGCGCLEATVLHEVTHTIGYNESQARGAERKCFSCAP